MYYRFVIAAALMGLPSAAFAQASLEQRVERMEAESDIRRVLVEYGAFLDARDYSAYAGLFATDGEWVGGFGTFRGPRAIRQMLEDSLGKPEPEAFAEIARQIQVPASRVVFVGNDERCDVQGAIEAGMRAVRCHVWARSAGPTAAAVTIDRFMQIPAVAHALLEEAPNRHAA